MNDFPLDGVPVQGFARRRVVQPWLDIADCLVWCDARDAVDDGNGRAEECPDRVGGAPLIQPSISARPFILAGSPPRLRFTGTIAGHLSRIPSDGAPWVAGSWTIVGRAEGFGALGGVRNGGNTELCDLRGGGGANLSTQQRVSGSLGSAVASPALVPGAGNHTLAVTGNGTARAFYLDGVSAGASTTLPTNLSAPTEYRWSVADGPPAQGFFAMWGRPLSAAELDIIHAYAASVWP